MMLRRLTISSSLAFEFHLLTEMILAGISAIIPLMDQMFLHGSQPYSLWQHCILLSLTLSLSLSLSQCVCLCSNMHLCGTKVFIFPGYEEKCAFLFGLRFKLFSTDVKPVYLAWQNNGKHNTSRTNSSCPIQLTPATDCVSINLSRVSLHSLEWMLRNPNWIN